MEAGDGAASDGDKQKRQQGRRAGRNVTVDHRRDNLGVAQQDSTVKQDQPDEQLQAVDVVAGLQEHPDGKQ